LAPLPQSGGTRRSLRRAITGGRVPFYLLAADSLLPASEYVSYSWANACTPIVKHLDLLDAKRGHHQQLRDSLHSLLRTLLHQLMMAQVRMDQVDLSELAALGIEVDG